MGEINKAVQLAVSTIPLGTSTQPDDSATDPWTPEGSIRPPLDLDALATLTAQARIRRSCIAAIVHNTVGLGYSVRVRSGKEEDVTDIEAETRIATETLNALSRRDKRMMRPSFGRQMRAVIWDKYECGNGYLEVSRNRTTGEIDGFFHVPGKRVRRRKEGGWLVLNKHGGSLSDSTTYYDFGEKVNYDDDGKPVASLAKGGGGRWNVNELIPFQLYTSESRDYGLPPDGALAADYLSDKLAGETNISFFDSKGVPPTVIFIQGEEVEEGEVVKIEVPEKYIKQITNTLRASGQQQHRVAVIGVPSGFKAQTENLAVTSDRDLGYTNFRGDNRRAVLAAFRISPVFVADIEDAGRYTAEVERQLTKEQVFDPEQQEVQEILDLGLIAELFPHLHLKFDEMRIAGDEVQRASAFELATLGRITNGELREAHGYGPLPEAAENADKLDVGQVPFGWNRELVEPGLTIHGGGVDAGSGRVANATGKGSTNGQPPPRASLAAARGNTSSPENPSGTGLIGKSTPESELERGVEAEFDAHVEEAIRLIREQTGAIAEPIVVEKQGDSIVIAPYSGSNGTGG